MDCHGNVEISGVREPRGNIRLLFGEDLHAGKRVSRILVIRVECESCVAFASTFFSPFFKLLFI